MDNKAMGIIVKIEDLFESEEDGVYIQYTRMKMDRCLWLYSNYNSGYTVIIEISEKSHLYDKTLDDISKILNNFGIPYNYILRSNEIKYITRKYGNIKDVPLYSTIYYRNLFMFNTDDGVFVSYRSIEELYGSGPTRIEFLKDTLLL